MKVNAGIYKHRVIKVTNLETTRETSDKVRQAIFNLIGQFFHGGKALDLFAGSGSMGIEALSRGIEFVVFNDINKDALRIVKDNIESLKISDQVRLMNYNYKECLERLDTKFDLIFLDPPYAMKDIEEIINNIIKNNLLNDDGLIICEMAKDTIYKETNELYLLKERTYGIKKVIILKKGD